MNALVKKEIRLLMPSWILALLLAMVQVITRPYDFYIASMLFFGLTIMALTPIGREASLNTFSSLLAQPAERIQIWKTKLCVLAIAFLTVFLVWLTAFGIACFRSNSQAEDMGNAYYLFITVCLIATATFTGGLWTTLLLRQLAGAFWLTLLLPATLSGFAAGIFASRENEYLVIAALSTVIGVYSLAGFLFARRMFFRAQDVGWSGGVIALPEWKFSTARKAVSETVRRYQPLFALVKKEFQIHQASLTGAAGLLVLHAGVIVLRACHQFPKDSAGEMLTSIFWMLWVVMAPVIGGMAVAEERRLGMMEGQLCFPVSRRKQFGIKGFITLFLAIFLGGFMPMLLEYVGVGLGAHNPVFAPENKQPGQTAFHSAHSPFLWYQLGVIGFAAWLALIGFFASTLAKNFLQAMGFGVAVFFGCVMIIPLFTGGRMLFLDWMSSPMFLPLLIAIPTIIVTLFWLAYRNFNDFREGWPLWQRNIGGILGALFFIFISSNVIYHRAWEVFEPAEPAHGPARLSLNRPPVLIADYTSGLQVCLPDGRVWGDYLKTADSEMPPTTWNWVRMRMLDPLVKSAGESRFIAGAGYSSAVIRHIDFDASVRQDIIPPGTRITGYLATIGVKTNGTLWISSRLNSGAWNGDKMSQFGAASDWQKVVRMAGDSVLLLKTNGTLWAWGAGQLDFYKALHHWPDIRDYPLRQIGNDSDWREIYDGSWLQLVRKADGQVWRIFAEEHSGKYGFERDTNLDNVPFETLSISGSGAMAYVRADGTLWVSWIVNTQNGKNVYSAFVEAGTGSDWKNVTLQPNHLIIALKKDGTLWQWQAGWLWNSVGASLVPNIQEHPKRLGTHNDWVALSKTWDDALALAADGSLWLWPNRQQYEEMTLLALPKQPEYLGNAFVGSN